MANGAIFFTWGNPVRGRELEGLRAMSDFISDCNELAKERRVRDVRVYLNRTGNTAKWSGTMILEGDLDELRQIQTERTYQRNLERAAIIVENLTVSTCIGGSPVDIEEPITNYMEGLAAFGLTNERAGWKAPASSGP